MDIAWGVGRISLDEAAGSLEQVVHHVAENSSRVTITLDGRPVAVLISVAELDAMEERLFNRSAAGARTSQPESPAAAARPRGRRRSMLGLRRS